LSSGAAFVLLFVYALASLGVVVGVVSPVGAQFHHKPAQLLWFVVGQMSILLIFTHIYNSVSEEKRSVKTAVKRMLCNAKLIRPPLEIVFWGCTILALGFAFSAVRMKMHSPQLITLPVADEPLRVMTFNIFQAQDMQGRLNVVRLVNIVQDFDPHVVGFQESDAVHLGTDNVDPVTYVAGMCRLDSFFGISHLYSTVGASLLSKTEMFSKFAEAMYAIGPKSLTRPYLQAEIYYNNTKIIVMNVHLESPYTSEEDAQYQINFIVGKLNTTTDPVILLGDFNCPPDSDYIAQIREAGMISAYEMKYNLTEPPYNTTYYGATYISEDKHFDYIFYRDLVLVDAGIYVGSSPDLREASNHYPVFSLFKLEDEH